MSRGARLLLGFLRDAGADGVSSLTLIHARLYAHEHYADELRAAGFGVGAEEPAGQWGPLRQIRYRLTYDRGEQLELG